MRPPGFEALRRLARSPGSVAALIVAVLLAGLWLTLWQRVRFERDQAIAAASHANANLVIAYEENIDNSIGGVEQLLSLAAAEYVAQGPRVAEAMSLWQLDPQLVRGLEVEGSDGTMVAATGESVDGALHVAARYHRAHADNAMRMGRPETVETDGRSVVRITMSRRVAGPDGRYGGTVLAIVNPAFFTHFFTRIDPDANAVVELVGLDGIAVARQAGKSATFGDDMRGSRLFARLASAPVGNFVSRGARDGVKRLMSYRRLARYPLVVLVGSSLEETLAPAFERERLYVAMAAAASALIVIVALGLLGAVARHRRDYRALAQAEARWRETAARKDAIADNMAGGVIISSLDGVILSVNRAACEMHGYAREEMVGMPLERLLSEPDRAALAKRLTGARVGTDGHHEVKEVRALRKDGSVFEAEVIGSVVDLDGGGNLVGIVHDITERKATERALRRSEALYRATFDQALLGIIHTGMDGRFIRANRRACEMVGYTEAEMLRLGYRDLTHPEDLEESVRRHDALLAEPREPFEFQVTRRYLRKDGSILWALASVGVIRREDGMPDFFLTMVQDITELKRVEEMKNEFISTVSHELRSPLTSIRGSLGLLVGGVAGPLPKAARELAVIGERNCERLVRLVNDILDTERMEAGRMRFDLHRADLRVLASRAVESMQGLAVLRGVKLALSAPGQPLEASVDDDRFVQAVTNLLSNAIKFSPAGAAVEVVLSRPAEGRTRLEVRDRGPGIAKEFEGRIFQRFAQADASTTRSQGGTGLGLYIAKGIVERLGGTIGYDTRPGQGTTFHIELPSAPSALPVRELELHA